MASITKRPDGRWRARYRDNAGKEHARHFDRKVDGQRWLDSVTASVQSGTYVDPKTAKMTVAEWCETWLSGYATKRASTVRQARVHINQIIAEFGSMQLSAVRPSQVRAWTSRLADSKLAPSYVNALHLRLSQVLSDAVHDGLIPRNPCSRRTSPGAGSQRPYLATTKQIWELYDDFPEHLAPAVLLGAFVGLRTAEAAGLRTTDVDFTRGVVTPAVQYPDEPLKTETSRTAIPIPNELALELSAAVARFGSGHVVTDKIGRQSSPWAIERAMRSARSRLKRLNLPDGFRFHDLRHYFASLLIASGADVKVVQARLRHASAKTTLDTYSHLWPDRDESTRAAIGSVIAARADSVRTGDTV